MDLGLLDPLPLLGDVLFDDERGHLVFWALFVRLAKGEHCCGGVGALHHPKRRDADPLEKLAKDGHRGSFELRHPLFLLLLRPVLAQHGVVEYFERHNAHVWGLDRLGLVA